MLKKPYLKVQILQHNMNCLGNRDRYELIAKTFSDFCINFPDSNAATLAKLFLLRYPENLRRHKKTLTSTQTHISSHGHYHDHQNCRYRLCLNNFQHIYPHPHQHSLWKPALLPARVLTNTFSTAERWMVLPSTIMVVHSTVEKLLSTTFSTASTAPVQNALENYKLCNVQCALFVKLFITTVLC